jgi:hypothetical protein
MIKSVPPLEVFLPRREGESSPVTNKSLEQQRAEFEAFKLKLKTVRPDLVKER